SPGSYPYIYPSDPSIEQPPLPDPDEMLQSYQRAGLRERARERIAEQHAGGPTVRTAMTMEVRDGVLCVFMPPVEQLEDYLELLTAVEASAEEQQLTVHIEGYLPPHDPRLNVIKVAPDPGVIEVNVPPVSSWPDLVRLRHVLDEEARSSRLGAEKFEIDGLHTGTGGGDHLVLGGPTAAESPFLRRPHLLGALVAYWNNHPSLSYLFSGRFIGPTSQAPRIDEARHESLYELEIALQEMRRAGPVAPPWFVDRVFRDILTDMTGNTHRTEFCIDKLFSPDTDGGRRGLVELRAFEMQPHVRMGLLAQLVVRACVAWFAREPAVAPARLVRWGTSLHDRFLLPHFLMRDFREVVADLRAAGFPFEQEWFECFAEFRFPRLGSVTHDGVTLKLRAALEPWHVLGEEPVGGATSRLVDSSLERVEVRVTGLVSPRHVVACNRRRVPLVPTGIPGEFVAGVRYRAWQPPRCLHPTVPVHAPLVFDIIDLWSGRSLGGCTWHVAHPGGRNYETRPVNALEAEGRRASRFFASGHTPGPCPLPPEDPNPDYACTLDLRRRSP
ncbi:MAG: transglutaminase family protein, partial [Planctomycetaceae bacterium]